MRPLIILFPAVGGEPTLAAAAALRGGWPDHEPLRLLGCDSDPAKRAIMDRPGAKVLHAPVVDARTHCLALSDCFAQVAAWSRAHPGHAPIVIFVNTKEEPFNTPAIPDPPLYTEADLAGIDADAVKAFGRAGVIAPDDLRGDATSLRAAALAGRWPSLEASRGKVLSGQTDVADEVVGAADGDAGTRTQATATATSPPYTLPISDLSASRPPTTVPTVMPTPYTASTIVTADSEKPASSVIVGVM